MEDLYFAAKTMNWSRAKVTEFIHDLDPKHEDAINAQEFMLIMKYIEQKNETNVLPAISSARSLSKSPSNMSSRKHIGSVAGASDDQSAYAQDRKKYGALLPHTGVYFLPDDRVICFLTIAEEMKKRYEAKMDYNNAWKYKDIIIQWRVNEEKRQMHNMRIAQFKEMINIENAQKL
jgi:hypothetical protein